MPSHAQNDPAATLPQPTDVRAFVDYLRDLGIFDLLTRSTGKPDDGITAWASQHLSDPAAVTSTPSPGSPARPSTVARPGSVQPSMPPVPQVQRPAPTPSGSGSAQPARATPVVSPFEQAQRRGGSFAPPQSARPGVAPAITITPPAPASLHAEQSTPAMRTGQPGMVATEMPAPTPFNQLAPLPNERCAPAVKAAALQAVRDDIGDCTRCPLAYAGRHSIVFADGNPNARLMFVGEGPGADEDEQGLPFVGKAGQLLNNMIGAMGLQRAEVYIANIVKCRPPKNRVPEPVEANTCSQFLLRQIDIVQPEVIVALGSTAATYLLGLKQSLSSLRGQWFDVRGAKCAVTYHPAFLLRDPHQKGEAWKDLQRVMVELKLKPPARA